jgi:hypothetical protein
MWRIYVPVTVSRLCVRIRVHADCMWTRESDNVYDSQNQTQFADSRISIRHLLVNLDFWLISRCHHQSFYSFYNNKGRLTARHWRRSHSWPRMFNNEDKHANDIREKRRKKGIDQIIKFDNFFRSLSFHFLRLCCRNFSFLTTFLERIVPTQILVPIVANLQYPDIIMVMVSIVSLESRLQREDNSETRGVRKHERQRRFPRTQRQIDMNVNDLIE